MMAAASAAQADPAPAVPDAPPVPNPAPAPRPALSPPGVSAGWRSAAPGMQPAQPLLSLDDTEEVGYRGQMLIADGASVALMFTGTRVGGSVGALGYLILGPVIHGSHDQGGRTAVSLGLRIGLPLLGALAFAQHAESTGSCRPPQDVCDDDGSEFVSALVGFGVGMLVAMVVDDLIVARPVIVHKESQRTWAPTVNATSQKVSVGMLARF